MTAEEILKAKGCMTDSFDYPAFNAAVTKYFLSSDTHFYLNIHSRRLDRFCTDRVQKQGFVEDLDGKCKDLYGKNNRVAEICQLILERDKKYKDGTFLDVVEDLYGEDAADKWPLYFILGHNSVPSSIIIHSIFFDRVVKALKQEGFKIGRKRGETWIYLA